MKTYIWTAPSRIFHWLLAIGFTVAYILGDYDNLSNWHFAFGAFVGALLFFRVLFALFGPIYSRFKDFPIGLNSQREFINSFFLKTKSYAGHNPVASLIMLSIFIVGIVCSISGYYLYAGENNVSNIGISEDFLEDFHEITATVFLILVGIHLLGILLETLLHKKTGTLKSIFTGYKNVESENTKLNGSHKAFSLLWFVIPLYIFYWAYQLPVNSKEKEKKDKIEHREKHKSKHDKD